MDAIRKLWNGEYSLAITFWICNILMSILMGVANQFINPAIENVTPVALKFAYLILHVSCFAAYDFVAAMGLWRAARRYGGHVAYKYMALFFVFLKFAGIAAAAWLLSVRLQGLM